MQNVTEVANRKEGDTDHVHRLVKHPRLNVVFPLEKPSEKLHLQPLRETIGRDAFVTGLFPLSLAHALRGALVLADEACVGLVAENIFLWCAGVADTRRDEKRLCLWCRREEDELLCGL